jgi:hypothetical protein
MTRDRTKVFPAAQLLGGVWNGKHTRVPGCVGWILNLLVWFGLWWGLFGPAGADVSRHPGENNAELPQAIRSVKVSRSLRCFWGVGWEKEKVRAWGVNPGKRFFLG